MRNKAFNGLSLAGLSATFVGNGIGRFAYVALMPALIQAGWFSKSDASYLGVATLAGYLLGAPLAHYLTKMYSLRFLLRVAMLLCSMSYLACALQNKGLPWFYFWRTMAGVGGAMLMVLAAPAIVIQHREAIRGKVSGIIFSGIGLGAMASGTLIPLLISQSVAAAWLGMGTICLLLTILTWGAWGQEAPATAKAAAASLEPMSKKAKVAAFLVLLAYVLNAVGYLPHTLFWIDYIVRELKMPLAAGGFFWAVFGLGAAVGPLITGTLGDYFGFKRCLMACFLLKAMGVALPLFSSSPAALFLSSFLVGAFTPGIVAIISTYMLECVGAARHRKAWSAMTFSFAASQLLAGYFMAAASVNAASYRPLFLISAIALVFSALCIFLVNPKPEPSLELSLKGSH
ncbi:YbfB/YjiJ family MFS transporter [Iodobacter fluviatilis]|uniref:MFS family arabinose efflux permease n=1 Tax=Iodobacter fluviatilis TaxID=537 RepID=A0A377Q527_9NEIS|nr:YbfB/YjiJ family MFS transporter [Iodobacter fluviatilis]TCU87003.1 putative MFS family arabinose efflux permease [Iodobacter fluviatilis]STQ90334.1 putative sialic acid transporter [Iodobacter fluviatilis]